jgi:hypothetical protein
MTSPGFPTTILIDKQGTIGVQEPGGSLYCLAEGNAAQDGHISRTRHLHD